MITWLFHNEFPYHVETSPLIYRANQWTGFYMTESSVMKELIIFFSYVSVSVLWSWHCTHKVWGLLKLRFLKKFRNCLFRRVINYKNCHLKTKATETWFLQVVPMRGFTVTVRNSILVNNFATNYCEFEAYLQ